MGVLVFKLEFLSKVLFIQVSNPLSIPVLYTWVSMVPAHRRDDRLVAGLTCKQERTGEVVGWKRRGAGEVRVGKGDAEAGILPEVGGRAEPR